MPLAFSNDLKWRIVYLHYDGFLTTQIAQMLYISKYTVKKVLKIHKKWRCVVDSWLKKAGCHKIFNRDNMKTSVIIILVKVYFITNCLNYQYLY